MDRRAIMSAMAASLLVLVPSANATEIDRLLAEKPRQIRVLRLESQARPQQCCRVCSIGKACGNSCISVDKQCHQPPGCACDG